MNKLMLLATTVGFGYWLGRKARLDHMPRSECAEYLLNQAVFRLTFAASTFAKAKKKMHDKVLEDQALMIEESLQEIYELQKIAGGIRGDRQRIKLLKIAVKAIREDPDYFPEITQTDPAGDVDEFEAERSQQLREALQFIEELAPDSPSPRSER